MKILEVMNIYGGEILATPVYTEEKEVLIPQGTVLKKEYASLLDSLGINFVEIISEDEEEKTHHIITKQQFKEFEAMVKNILEKHVYSGKGSLVKIQMLANQIIDTVEKQVNGREHIVFDMSEHEADLYSHTIYVSILSIVLAMRMGLSQNSIYNIAVGSLLHDLGIRYITVPYTNTVIEELTPAEIFEFKKHTILAYTVLESEKWLPRISKNIVLSHHERFDGNGFPLKQKNQEIECKIVQICDYFDSSISGMECKKIGLEAALDYILITSNRSFDAEVVKEFTSMIARYPVGTEIELDSGSKAIVIEQTLDAMHPRISQKEEVVV